MYMNDVVSSLFSYAAQGTKLMAANAGDNGQAGWRHGCRAHGFHGRGSQMRHIAMLSRRIDAMAQQLARLKAADPTLGDASTLVVQRNQSASFSYIVTQDENGAVTASFTYTIQYKPAGGADRVEAAVAAATEDAVEPTQSPTTVAPSDDAEPSASAASETTAEAPALTEAEYVAQLIEKYRIDSVSDPETAELASQSDDARSAAAESETAATTDDAVHIDAHILQRLISGFGDDNFAINAALARRIYTGFGDDSISINADKVARIRSGAGDDIVNIEADSVRRINTGAGDDRLTIDADHAARIDTGAGDDEVTIDADTITRLNTGGGDDVLTLTANTIRRVDAGAGDDVITLDADDAAIAFSKGGGEDAINISSVGALAIDIDGALAASSEDMTVETDGDTVTLSFASGESLTLNGVANADMISVHIGGESVDLHVSDAPAEMDMSA